MILKSSAKTGQNGRPVIRRVAPAYVLPGGEVAISGSGLLAGAERPLVRFGKDSSTVVFGSEELVIAKVPEDASSGPLTLETAGGSSEPVEVNLALPIAENLHPVANPAVDSVGNIYATFSGERGQSVPVSIFRIDAESNVKPFLSNLMNATGLALDADDNLYVSSRNDGAVYVVSPAGELRTYAQGLGVATGIAFDEAGNLYVGDRSGTIFKIGLNREIFVFATLEASVAAYHLAFSPNGNLYVTGPTTSSNDAVWEVSPQGNVKVFFRGLGRPQGLAFDAEGAMHLVASYRGLRGVHRLADGHVPEIEVAGSGLVGLAFAPEGAMVLATHSGLNYLECGIEGFLHVPKI